MRHWPWVVLCASLALASALRFVRTSDEYHEPMLSYRVLEYGAVLYLVPAAIALGRIVARSAGWRLLAETGICVAAHALIGLVFLSYTCRGCV